MIKKRILAGFLAISLFAGSTSTVCRANEADNTTEISENSYSDVTTEAATETTTETSTEETSDETTEVLSEEVTEETVPEEDTYIPDGYLDFDLDVGIYQPVANSIDAELVTATASYDSRDYNYITDVKNQNPYGTCWAFSTMSVAETSLIKHGQVQGTPDLSEYQFAYFLYNDMSDPLGNMDGDSTKSAVSNYLNQGGNNWMSMFELSTWRGVVEEQYAPYTSVSSGTRLDSSLASATDCFHMQNAYMVSMNDKDSVKKLILDNGSVASSVRWDTSYMAYGVQDGDFSLNYDYSGDDSQKYKTNHAITVIGWDDNYSKTNFVEGHQPVNNGAWLVKNSWGTQNSYGWVSYEDVVLVSQNAVTYYFEPADNYDFNYQYDGGLNPSYLVLYDGYSCADTYVAKGSAREEIDAVSIGLYDTNVNYSIQIYKNSPEGDPAGGTPMLSEPITGQTTYMGYYTIPVDETVYVDYGETFSVVFTLSSGNGTGTVQILTSNSYSGQPVITESTAPNQSFIIYNTGYVKDLNDYTRCARIKAFTTQCNLNPSNDLQYATITNVNDCWYSDRNNISKPVVYCNGQRLTENVDYRVVYYNKNNPGTATVEVYGIGEYYGRKKATFRIKGVANPATVYNGVNYSPVYDYEYYVRTYPDIWNAFGEDSYAVLAHFVNNGIGEGRRGNAIFDVTSYAYLYPDLRSAFKNDKKSYYLHYIYNGRFEGRVAIGCTSIQGCTTVYNGIDYSSVYDGAYYMKTYPDISKAFGFDDYVALAHFVNDGMNEGRRGKTSFDVTSYAYRYPDLRRAFKNNKKMYYLHYIFSGSKEKRIATGCSKIQGCTTVYGGVDYSKVYDGTYYMTTYTDISRAFGFDDEAALAHFVNCGMNEGRQGIASFNVYAYKNNYADLRNAFGNTLKMYYIHYITNGYNERRKATY